MAATPNEFLNVQYVLLYIGGGDVSASLMTCAPTASLSRKILDIGVTTWNRPRIVAGKTYFGPGDVFIGAIQIRPVNIDHIIQIAAGLLGNVEDQNLFEHVYEEIKAQYEVPNPMPAAQIAGIALSLIAKQTDTTPESIYEEYFESMEPFY